MDSFCVHMPATAPAEVAAQLADAAAAGHDDEKLRRALVGGGAAKAVAALLLALSSRSLPAGGVFLRGGTALLCAYYAVLAAVALFGGLEVAVGFWVAGTRTAAAAGAGGSSGCPSFHWSSSPDSVVSPC